MATFEELILALDQHSDLIAKETRIGRNTNERVGLLGKKVVEVLEKIGDSSEFESKYLSKVSVDTAQEIIHFLKGIVAAGTSEFINMLVSGKITAKDIDVNDTLITDILRVITRAELTDAVLKGQLNSETFASGMLGEGFRLKDVSTAQDGSDWVLEIDRIVVRKTMDIHELIVNQMRYQSGLVLHSPAGGLITKVEDGGSYWRCEHDSTVDFISGSFIYSQNFNVGSRLENPTGSQTFRGASVKRWWRKVTSYGTGWFNLSKTSAESGSANPEVDDEIAVLGHESNPDWQNAIMISSVGSNSPFIAYYSGINTFSLVGKEVMREGNLSGIVDEKFGQLSGFGLYSRNVYLRGKFRLATGEDIGMLIDGLDGRTEQAETSLDIMSGLIASKVSRSEYDSKIGALESDISLIEQKADSVDISVKNIRLGLYDLIKNYEGKIKDNEGKPMFWTIGAVIIDDDGATVKPAITSIVLSQNNYTVQQGTTLTPNTSATVYLTNGTSRQVTLTWAAIDTSQIGTKQAFTTNYIIPSDIQQTPKPAAVITINVTAAPVSLTIVSVSALPQVDIIQNQTPNMPANIVLNISDGSTRTVAIAWGSVNTSTVGTRQIQSSNYSIPQGIETTPKPNATVTVNVTATQQQLYIASVVQLAQVQVYQYDTPSMPNQITLNISDGTTRLVAVTWGSYNTNTVGTFNIEGAYNLPAGVTGSKPSVWISLKVNETQAGTDVVDLLQLIKNNATGWTAGSDQFGSYVEFQNPSSFATGYHAMTEALDGSFKVFVKYNAQSGAGLSPRVGGYNGSFPQTWNIPLQTNSKTSPDFATAAAAASDTLVYGQEMIKYYKIEARNDNQTPSWYTP